MGIMETATSNLIEAIDRQRIKRQMSLRRFSREVLGISPAYYCLIKQGKRRITLDVLQIIMQKLPEVTPAVTIFIMSQGDDGKNKKHPSENGGGKPLGLLGTRKGSEQPQKT